jgi:hypothetical protein
VVKSVRFLYHLVLNLLMQNYYHITPNCCLDSILKRGLIPFSQLEKELPPEEWSRIRPEIPAPVLSDNTFIYFHRKPPSPDQEPILIVCLPEGFPVERDYDQFLYQLKLYDGSLGQTSSYYRRAMSLVFDFIKYPDLKSLRGYYEEKFAYHKVRFSGELTTKNIKAHVDKISEESWQSVVYGGSYRTKRMIKPKRIAVFYKPPNLFKQRFK